MGGDNGTNRTELVVVQPQVLLAHINLLLSRLESKPYMPWRALVKVTRHIFVRGDSCKAGNMV